VKIVAIRRVTLLASDTLAKALQAPVDFLSIMATSLSFISLLTKWLPTTEATSDDQTLYFHFGSRSSRLKGIAGQKCVGRLVPVVTDP